MNKLNSSIVILLAASGSASTASCSNSSSKGPGVSTPDNSAQSGGASAATGGVAGMPIEATGGSTDRESGGGSSTSDGGTGGMPLQTAGSGGAAVGGDGGTMPPTEGGDVLFSPPSGTFQGSLAVTMAAGIPGMEIRYTTDGLPPTASSTLYEGAALALSETTQLRVQLFDTGAAVGTPSSAIYIRRTFDVTSDIPLIVMEGYGAGKPPADSGPERVIFRDVGVMLFEPSDGEASLSSAPTWATRAGYHVRGQSSASFEKTPYRIELWDEFDEDESYPMIGMPSDADWALVGPYLDKTLVRNPFVYSLAEEMGLEGPTLRFAELYLNQDSGPLSADDYQGVYAITESIKNKKSRVNLKQLRPDDTAEADLSGGYIFKFDGGALREDEGEIEIPCISDILDPESEEEDTCFTDLELTDPKSPNDEQLGWIQAYVQELHDALHAEPLGDYQGWLDLPSFVDQILLNEFTMGGDIYTRSVYMHKDRDGLIKAGPVWDYNFTMGNLTSDPETWQIDSDFKGSNDWFRILFVQPEFRALAVTRWAELRQGLLADDQILARIDAVSAPLVNAGPRDLQRWPVGEGGFSFPGGDDEVEEPTTWEGQITALKQWTTDRAAWIDVQMTQL